jgi:hypothetical protein
MDGLEIAATALSSTMTYPTCECPKDELDRTDKLYPVRTGQTSFILSEALLMSVLGSRRPVQSSWNGTGVSRIDALGRSVVIYNIIYDINHVYI